LIAAVGRNDKSIEIDDTYAGRVAHCVWDDLLRETDEISRLQTGIVESVDGRVRSVERNVERRIRAKFGLWWASERVAAQIWDLVARPVARRVKDLIGEAVARAVHDSFKHLNTNRPWNLDRVWARYEANHETYRWLSLCSYDAAPHFAYLEYFHSYYRPNQAHALAQFAQLVSGFWLGRTVALLVRKPVVLARDAAGRLHNEAGPAVQCTDRWGFWSRHGVLVPSWVVERPAEELTRDDFFAQTNSEVRRVIQERMRERFIWEVGARFVASGARGILYEVEFPGERESIARYVEVRDASSERVYYLRVPPDIKTAEEAVAWTFGLTTTDYQPAQET
jgi:hypothetical protein